MSGNLSLLTVLFIMCYFIKEGENLYAVTTITRAHRDYFTDGCQNCYKYGAKREQGICICEPQSSTAGIGSVFLPDQSHCKDGKDLVTAEYCHMWKNSFVEVIDTEGTNRSYFFIKEAVYSSYQLEPLISYRNSTTGEWQYFNLSGNVLMLQNGSDPRLSQIKVTRVSPSLTQFRGYVMKLRLKRKTLDGKTYKSCLLFKAKGEARSVLDCSVPTTTITTTTITTTTPPPVSNTTGIPTTATPSSSTTTVPPTMQIVILIQIAIGLVK